MNLKNYFKKVFYDLVLKKSLSIHIDKIECFLELTHQGETLHLFSVLHQAKLSLSDAHIQFVEDCPDPGMVIDKSTHQILLARKINFTTLSPDTFSLKVSHFYHEIKKYREEISEFKGKGFSYIKRT